MYLSYSDLYKDVCRVKEDLSVFLCKVFLGCGSVAQLAKAIGCVLLGVICLY